MDEELGSASITITLDDTGVVRDAERLGDRIQRALERASRDGARAITTNIQRAVRAIDPVRVRIEADTTRFRAAVSALGGVDAVRVPVVPDVDRAAFTTAVNAALAGIEIPIRVVPDLSGFNAAIRAHRVPDVTVGVNADTSAFSTALSRLGGVASSAAGALGGLLRFGALGIAAAGAAQSVLALGAALAPAVGILAAGPAVVLGFAGAIGTLRLALSGVSDAFSAALTGDAEDFADALENLSPAAQAAAREVRDLRPAFEALRSSVQDAFFGPLEGQITAVARALSGPLTSGLSSVAAQWGAAAAGVASYLSSAEGVSNVESVLGATQGALRGLAGETEGLSAGFLRVAAAISDAFGTRLESAIASTLDSFGGFLSRIAEGGQAVAWVEAALSVFTQLGGVLRNVGSILGSVFSAAEGASGGLLGNLREVTGSFAEFLASARGQEALTGLFQGLSSVAAQLGPILSALVTQVGAIAPALVPVFEALGPALVGVVDALGPALAAIAPSLEGVASALSDALAAVGPALGPIGSAISEVVEAITPLLPLVGDVAAALGTVLAPILSALAGAVRPLVTALSGALTPVLPILTEASLALSGALGPLAEQLGTALAGAVTALSPLLTSLATALADLAVGLVPVIEQFTNALVPTFTQMIPILNELAIAFAPLIEQLVAGLVPILPTLAESIIAVQTAFLPLIPTLAELLVSLTPFLSLVLTGVTTMLQFEAAVVSWVSMEVVVPIITGIVTVLNGFISAVTFLVDTVTNLVPTITGVFGSMASTVSSTVSGMVSAVVGFFRGLPSQASGAVEGIISSVTGVFQSAKSAVEGVVRDLVSSVVSTLRGLPDEARSALSGASTALVSVGRDLIQGMINGVRDMAGNLADAARSVAQSAYDAVTGFFQIGSPSKLFREIGRFVGQGLINGLTSTEASIEQTSTRLAELIRDAFRGRNTNLDNRLIAQVTNTSNRLEALARQRDAIANRIQQANELAAGVRQQSLDAFNLQNLAQRGGGIQGITDGIDEAIRQVQRFNRQINQLAQRGLRRDLLSQIIGLGPQQGGSLASTLANATNAQLRELNEAQRQLDAASKRLGRDSADALFDSGREASRGFLAGLRDQQEDIEDLMLSIARSMQRAIRNALGIRSPSRVFRRIGRFAMDGLTLGVDDRVGSVRRSALGAVSAITDPFGGVSGLGATTSVSGRQTASGGRSQVNNITINEVGDAEATANRILSRLAMAGGGL